MGAVPIFELSCVNNESIDDCIRRILTTKLKAWEKEREIRFIRESESDKHCIGRIVSVYFGNPYDNLRNKSIILSDKSNKQLRSYLRYLRKLLHVVPNEINLFSVKLRNGRIEFELVNDRSKFIGYLE